MNHKDKIDEDWLWPTTSYFPCPITPDNPTTRVWKRLNFVTAHQIIGCLLAQPTSPARAVRVSLIIEASEVGSGITLATLGYVDAIVPVSAQSHHEFVEYLGSLVKEADGMHLHRVVCCHPYGVFWTQERK